MRTRASAPEAAVDGGQCWRHGWQVRVEEWLLVACGGFRVCEVGLGWRVWSSRNKVESLFPEAAIL